MRSTAVDIDVSRVALVGLLMQAAVLGAAIKRLSAHEAFAAGEMNTALRAAHHVLYTSVTGRPTGTAMDLSFVTLEYPVRDNEDQYQQEKFQSAVPR
jgi:hypothetical protein